MKSYVTLLIILFSGLTFAQTTLIPDPAFEQHLISIGADSGTLDGSVPTAQIASITQLHMTNLGIYDLTGIEDFAALEILELEFNALTTLDVSQNTNLQFLFCSNNLLTNLDVSGCANLYSLDCDQNNLTNLDVSMNLTLAYLNCGRNDLNTLNISNNDLVLLGCYQNAITSIDVSGHPNLEILQCEDNQITTLNLSNNPALEFLNASSNLLTSLDISSNSMVNEFFCSNNNDLECLNVRNGNNLNFLLFEAQNNPLLSCIEVDDSVWSNANWLTNIDAGTEFSNLCSNPCSSNQLGFSKKIEEIVLELYPNPAHDIVRLKWDTALVEDGYFDILGIDGAVVSRGLIPAGTQQIEVELQNLARGVYFVRLTLNGLPMARKLALE